MSESLFLTELQAKACNFIKKETLAQVLSCEFCEISKNTFCYRTPLVAASEYKRFYRFYDHSLVLLIHLYFSFVSYYVFTYMNDATLEAKELQNQQANKNILSKTPETNLKLQLKGTLMQI